MANIRLPALHGLGLSPGHLVSISQVSDEAGYTQRI